MENKPNYGLTPFVRTVALAVSAFVIVCLVGGLTFLHSRAMRRASLYNAYIAMHQAHRDLIEGGQVVNPSPGVAEVFRYTNTFSIQGSNYTPVLGMRWKPLTSDGSIMVVTREGVVVWLDKKGAASIITFSEGGQRPPTESQVTNANR